MYKTSVIATPLEIEEEAPVVESAPEVPVLVEEPPVIGHLVHGAELSRRIGNHPILDRVRRGRGSTKSVLRDVGGSNDQIALPG